MYAAGNDWELLILDANPGTSALGCLTVGDLDGDGNIEIITGGDEGAILWYRPATSERGLIAELEPHVGVALEDVDGDGVKEVVSGYCLQRQPMEKWAIGWFDPGPDLHQPWTLHVIDPLTTGGPHDMLFADVDGDGEMELVANSMYCAVPGLFIYKRGKDVTQPWQKHKVQEGFTGEGTAAADLDGDGQIEIVSGPYLYDCPPGGPFSGPWAQNPLAPGFREMCRAALLDVTGNGRLDVVLTESEYPDGRMAWFESTPAGWVEHSLECPLNFAHSLCAWCDPTTGEARVFVAEMAQGGWSAAPNWDARLLLFASADGGKTWRRELVYQGEGVHEATAYDIDGDGEVEFVGEGCYVPRVLVWKKGSRFAPLVRYRHRFLDREKPYTGTDILAADVDGDGQTDVVCGGWWYRNPTWERYAIPGVYQVHSAYDLDGDGRIEFIATKKRPDAPPDNWYAGLTSDLCWLKPVDPLNGQWEEHPIGQGSGDWPHGTLVAPLLPGGRLALVAGYHDADEGSLPELFEIPADPRQHPWPMRTLAEISYGEEFVPYDMTGNGLLDIVAGRWWLENLGDGVFHPHQIVVEGFDNVARVRVADVNGNERPDIVVVEESVDWNVRKAYFVRVAWFENPGDPRSTPWKVHVIDVVRCPHSLDVADLDGDGQLEVVVGEHDPFSPYRSRCRLYVYKRADSQGSAWYRHALDDRFEHHDGAKVIELAPGRLGIMSHGWMDTQYVHLWEPR